MKRHIYVDETKAKGYVMVAASLGTSDVPRKELRGLILRGQRALHMQSESDQRRRALLTCIEGLRDHGLEVVVYDAGRRHGTQLAARRLCLEAIVADTVDGSNIVLDRDDTLVSADRQLLTELTRQPNRASISYRHANRAEELLLAIPDALAWGWARGGRWRPRVRNLASRVVVI